VCLLALTSLLLITGCGDDDGGDVERVDLTNVRIAEAEPVFEVLAGRTFEFTEGTTPQGGGLFFGVQNGELEFGEVTMGVDGVPRATFVIRDFDRRTPEGDPGEGEGDSDGEASCNFLVTRSTIPEAIAVGAFQKCGLCDTLITATGIPLNGSGPGIMSWDLAAVRDPNNTPRFRSLAVDVTVTVDGAGNLSAVDGVPVQAEAPSTP